MSYELLLPGKLILFIMSATIRYLIIALFTGLYWMLNPDAYLYNSLSLGLILLFGIPHGAADHKINATIKHDSSFVLYVVKYLLIAGGYVVWWLFMPAKSLLIFFLLSAYHFGQELMEEMGIRNLKPWEIMIWGFTILIAPILIAFNEVEASIEFAARTELPEITPLVQYLSVAVILTSATVHFFIMKSQDRMDGKTSWRLSMHVAILVLSYFVLPFLIAFTLYFILFHSWNAFQHQYSWLVKRISGYTIKWFLLDLSLFSFLSVMGLLVFLLIIKPDGWTELISYFFIVISVITLPHSILFDQFYKFRKGKEPELTVKL